jgi:hypothetical protein
VLRLNSSSTGRPDRRQIPRYNSPHEVRIDPKLAVRQQITKADDFPPGDDCVTAAHHPAGRGVATGDRAEDVDTACPTDSRGLEDVPHQRAQLVQERGGRLVGIVSSCATDVDLGVRMQPSAR